MNGIHAFEKLSKMNEKERKKCQFIMLTDTCKMEYMIHEISDEYLVDFKNDILIKENDLDKIEKELEEVENNVNHKKLLDNSIDKISDDVYNDLLDEFEGNLYNEIKKHFKEKMKEKGYNLLED